MSVSHGIRLPVVILLACLVQNASAAVSPKTLFSRYFGGNGTDEAFAVATDTTANIYVTGFSSSPSIETACNISTSIQAFVAKFDSAGQLLYCTAIPSSGFDAGFGIAADASGNAYVTGSIPSSDLPVINGLQPSYAGGATDAFLVKLDPTGQIVYSTYLGGSGGDTGAAVAVDNAGVAYVIGNTDSTDFPTFNAIQTSFGGGKDDVFVAKIDTAASGPSSLIYSTYLGGSLDEIGAGIAVDQNGNTYITGATQCCFPVTPDAFQSTAGLALHPFLTKLGPSGNLIYSTLVAGSGGAIPRSIAVDNSGAAYVSGETYTNTFPVTPNAFQNTSLAVNGNPTAFVLKLDPNIPGTAGLLFSTYLGGRGPDSASGIGVDAVGRIYVTGYTASPNYPNFAAIQPSFAGNKDAFLAEFDLSEPNGSTMQFSTFLGGPNEDQAFGLALASDSRIAVVGFTGGAFPTTGSFDLTYGGGTDAFVAFLSLDADLPVVTVPHDATLNATSPAGATFIFTVTATDDFQPNLVVTCTSPSGSTFPIGTNLDTCSATDASGNTGTGSFHVIVEGATDQIYDLMRYIGNLNLSSGLRNGLDTKLRAATQDPLPGACSDLIDFISQVNAHTGKDLSAQQGAYMNTTATRIRSVLGCK